MKKFISIISLCALLFIGLSCSNEKDTQESLPSDNAATKDTQESLPSDKADTKSAKESLPVEKAIIGKVQGSLPAKKVGVIGKATGKLAFIRKGDIW